MPYMGPCLSAVNRCCSALKEGEENQAEEGEEKKKID
jgi:hypothetical protein